MGCEMVDHTKKLKKIHSVVSASTSPKQNDKNVTFLLGRCDFSNNSSITHEKLTNGQQSKPFKVNFFFQGKLMDYQFSILKA